jgi:uroporphyrinogen-III synthase
MRRLVVLRPEPGASATVERARAMGLEAFAMPLFEIEPVDWEVPSADQFDGLLLTSANAVRYGGAGLGLLSALPVYAVGEATAAVARQAGFEIASCGNGGVDRLLETVPSDLRLLHLCGEHRIAPGVEREVTPIAVYRSIERAIPGDFKQIEGDVVAVHSPRAARRLAELADDLRIDRATIRLAAISTAAATAAGTGWELIEAAETPDDAALLALAARLCDKPVTR